MRFGSGFCGSVFPRVLGQGENYSVGLCGSVFQRVRGQGENDGSGLCGAVSQRVRGQGEIWCGIMLICVSATMETR